eukprot:TRINITY_DN33645_c0_g1_i1.p1 TRINITY_DN33645_c0_g1~~TRINITY_DN33645_c0_g1_i1.p1  ORF type:complete len:545 (-),score=106.85 TRINITY_DN33645_c0_g1_i1:586-2193(-)
MCMLQRSYTNSFQALSRCLFASCIALAHGDILLIPVSEFGSLRRSRIRWNTSEETSEHVADRVRKLRGGLGLYFHLREAFYLNGTRHWDSYWAGHWAFQLDKYKDASQYLFEEGRRQSYWNTTRWLAAWDDVPGMLHAFADVMMPQEKVFGLEEAAFAENFASKAGVGLFLLQSAVRAAWKLLVKSLKAAWARKAIGGVRLHVLVHELLAFRPELWRRSLGEAQGLLGGNHMCKLKDVHHHGRYMCKIVLMVALAKRHKYEYIACVDDDVILAPSALAFMLKSGPLAEEAGCNVISPIFQNGIPTAELWARNFLSTEERGRLFDCFAKGAGTRTSCKSLPEWTWNMQPVEPWDSTTWYVQVHEVASKTVQLGGTVFEGHLAIHPVRYNYTCLSMALSYALAKAPRELNRWRKDYSFVVDSTGIFKYICNNAWMMRTSLYTKVLQAFLHSKMPRPKKNTTPLGAYMNRLLRSNFTLSKHVNPNDEETMNRILRNTPGHSCFISKSFGIHPAYNLHPHWKNPFDDMVVHDMLELDVS